MSVSIQAEDFNLAAELSGFGDGAGAIVTFTGLVRDNDAGDLRYMQIEHYPAMTQKALDDIETQARARWTLTDCRILHRFGPLKPGEQIMMVATASPHRAEAFAAAAFLMDYLKSRAPFWKKEVTDAGENWVDAKEQDQKALDRW